MCIPVGIYWLCTHSWRGWYEQEGHEKCLLRENCSNKDGLPPDLSPIMVQAIRTTITFGDCVAVAINSALFLVLNYCCAAECCQHQFEKRFKDVEAMPQRPDFFNSLHAIGPHLWNCMPRFSKGIGRVPKMQLPGQEYPNDEPPNYETLESIFGEVDYARADFQQQVAKLEEYVDYHAMGGGLNTYDKDAIKQYLLIRDNAFGTSNTAFKLGYFPVDQSLIRELRHVRASGGDCGKAGFKLDIIRDVQSLTDALVKERGGRVDLPVAKSTPNALSRPLPPGRFAHPRFTKKSKPELAEDIVEGFRDVFNQVITIAAPLQPKYQRGGPFTDFLDDMSALNERQRKIGGWKAEAFAIHDWCSNDPRWSDNDKYVLAGNYTLITAAIKERQENIDNVARFLRSVNPLYRAPAGLPTPRTVDSVAENAWRPDLRPWRYRPGSEVSESVEPASTPRPELCPASRGLQSGRNSPAPRGATTGRGGAFPPADINRTHTNTPPPPQPPRRSGTSGSDKIDRASNPKRHHGSSGGHGRGSGRGGGSGKGDSRGNRGGSQGSIV